MNEYSFKEVLKYIECVKGKPPFFYITSYTIKYGNIPVITGEYIIIFQN